MIEANALNFAYRRGIPVLQDITCRIEDGEAVALLGHNGSGKTTLSRLFMALDHPRSGQVLVDGVDIAGYEPADLADKVGYVFQNPDLQLLGDTVFDEVAYGLQNRKMPKEALVKQVREAVEAMGLTPYLDKYPRGLSFGQKRRLGVAAALALQDPDPGRNHQRSGRTGKTPYDELSGKTPGRETYDLDPHHPRYGDCQKVYEAYPGTP